MKPPPDYLPPEQEESYLPEQQQKMRPRARMRVWAASIRRRRVRLLLGRTISLPLLLAFLFLCVTALGGGITLQLTNRPVFCLSCHEMGVHYATWRQSTHREVTCEECHIMPGTTNMLKSKLYALRQIYLHQKGGVKPSVIQGHVPDANCKHCHPTTSNLVVYHSLKITHRKHWERGISCTFCHERLVHGPRVEPLKPEEELTRERTPAVGHPISFIYPPTMATCFKCHDGKQAPNNCSLCHVTLGERRPAAFTTEWVEAHKQNINQEGRTCARCHQQDFCSNCHIAANPHPSDWINIHHEEFKKHPSSCPVCHRGPNEKAEDASMAFCASCHTVRREHKGLDWLKRHAEAFRQEPEKCTACHTQAWCADCHKISRAHPPDWLRTHPAKAKEKPDSCRTCHQENFCIACHRGKGPGSTPASHEDRQAWLANHRTAVEEGAEACSLCHTKNFCQACHTQARPASHQHGWLKLHGPQAAVSSRDCMICHQQDYCTSCHGLQMPHPADWLKRHKGEAAKKEKSCEGCHRSSFCDACHRATLPSSHTPVETWLNRHGEVAKAGKQVCDRCHTAALCDACHGLKMPHSSDWLPKAHTALGKSNPEICARCHKADYCISCHGVQMPHPSDWLEQHPKDPKASLKPDSACFLCHTRKDDCAACHGE